MIQLLATLTPLLAPAPSVAGPAIATTRAQDEGASVRWYDVRSIPTPLDTGEPGVLMGLPITTAKHEDLEPDSYDVPLPEDVALDLQRVLDAVERAIEADPEAAVDAIDLFNGRIRVTGNERAQERAARAVSALRTLANDEARVEVVQLPADRIPPGVGPLLTSGEIASLQDRFAGQPTLITTAPMGRRTIVGAGRTTTFLAEYDVEVAQAVMIADPVVSVIRSGLDVGLRLDRASDGRRVVLRAWGRDARLRTPIRKRAQEGFAGAEIELPEADAALFAGSALVEPGGGILIRCGAADAVLVRVLSSAGSGLPAESIAVGEHLVGSMRPDPPHFAPAEPSRGWSPPDESLAEATRPWESDTVSAFDFADRVLGLHRIANGLISLGGMALYMGPDDRRSELRTGFDEYGAAAPVHTFAVEAAHGILSAEETAALAASGDVTGFVRGATRVQGAVLEGDSMVLLGGAEAAYLKDYDAQIANGSAIHEPIVSAVFGGFSLWASPIDATESGGMRAWIDVQRQTFEDTLREIPISNFRADDPDSDDSPSRVSGTYTTDLTVELPDTRRASARSVVSLEPDVWSLVTVQPMASDGRCLVVAARARASR